MTPEASASCDLPSVAADAGRLTFAALVGQVGDTYPASGRRVP